MLRYLWIFNVMMFNIWSQVFRDHVFRTEFHHSLSCIVDTEGNSYPIQSFDWLTVKKHPKTPPLLTVASCVVTTLTNDLDLKLGRHYEFLLALYTVLTHTVASHSQILHCIVQMWHEQKVSSEKEKYGVIHGWKM